MTSEVPAGGGQQPPGTSTTPPPYGSPAPPQAPRSSGPNDFFGRIRGFGAVRPDDGRWFAGVATGLARRWDLDPLLVRGLFVALAFAGGLGVAAYGVAWMLLPQQDGRIHLQQALRGHITAGFVGSVIFALALFGGPGPWSDGPFGWGPPRFLMTLIVIGAIVWLVRRNPGVRGWTPPPVPGSTTGGTAPAGSPADAAPGTVPGPATAGPAPGPAAPYGSMPFQASSAPVPPWVPPAPPVPVAKVPDPARASRRISRVTIGVALLAAVAVIAVGGMVDTDLNTGLIAAATALAVLALGVLLAGATGRRAGGLAGLGVLLMVITLGAAGADSAGVGIGQNSWPVGERTWHPTMDDADRLTYNLGLGEGRLYLTDPGLIGTATVNDPLRVETRMGAGQMTITTPNNVPAEVRFELGAGQVTLPDGEKIDVNTNDGQSDGNGRRTLHLGTPGEPKIVIRVRQGAGQVDLRTAATTGPVVVTPTPSALTPSSTRSQ